MKKILLLMMILLNSLFAYKANIQGIYAVGIFNEAGSGENIQHVRKTKADYNGTCYTKIFVYGNIFNTKPEVSIGNSLGYYVKSTPIYDKLNIKIGEELLYKHYNVTNGLIRVTLRDRVYDSKVFVK